MGNVSFIPIQKSIIDSFTKSRLASKFYFTGGTALSVYYLQHRFSEDLDFFTQSPYDPDSVISFVQSIADNLKYDNKFTVYDNMHIFLLESEKNMQIKINFVYYPHKQIKKVKKENALLIDSMYDIAVNKLATINQRIEVKDFVDLYYLFKRYTIWDLLYGVEEKFKMKTDLLLLASDFYQVEQFEYLPRMIKPLTLPKLKAYFRKKSLELGKKVVA